VFFGALTRNRTRINPLGRDCSNPLNYKGDTCAKQRQYCTTVTKIAAVAGILKRHMNDQDNPVSNAELKALLVENQRLLTDNNALLHKMRRGALWATAFRLVWFTIILGMPIALYYFFLEPNFSTLERAWGVIESGAKEVTGLRQLLEQSNQ